MPSSLFARMSIALIAVVTTLAADTALAAEAVKLTPENFGDYAPAGKEADAIYGDVVLRNDRLVAVIAEPKSGRNANMTVRNVGGCLIDFTRREAQNDQLSAYYPGAGQVAFLKWGDLTSGEIASASALAEAAEAKPAAQVKYSLADGADHLDLEITFSNPHDQPIEVRLDDAVRADNSFDKGLVHQNQWFWAYDKWFGQAYAIDAGSLTRGDAESVVLSFVEDDAVRAARTSTLQGIAGGESKVMLEPGEEIVLRKKVIAGASVVELATHAAPLLGVDVSKFSVAVKEPSGNPIAAADVEFSVGGRRIAWGRTNQDGMLEGALPPGEFQLKVEHFAYAPLSPGVSITDGAPNRFELIVSQDAGYVEAKITDSSGGPIPCRVQFRGVEGTADPDFFINSGEHAVKNLYYSENGSFLQVLAPGKYDVIVSHGPEYDAVFTRIEIQPGETTPLAAHLVRTVDTAGWVSTEYHSHSSPSGDNTSSQLGRVLNLLCEHLEFAPCTEHNRIDTYDAHLRRLGATDLMATCTGMELTGGPLPINHQNAFPLEMHVHTQDGGAPVTDVNPVVQIERLAMWDDGSDKLVQTNHPNLVQMFGDKDLDGEPDGGFRAMFGIMDVMEVHPPHWILDPNPHPADLPSQPNRMLNWMQLLNLGFRIPGVVNTDAHYNFHGSGWLRNYVLSSSDDPAGIDVMEMVHNSEHGRLVMTTGPFMEVRLRAAKFKSENAFPGDDISIPNGEGELHVRVQCPNWFDVDRVVVFINGRPSEEHDYRRRTHSKLFTSQGAVRFDQKIQLQLDGDAHVIVAAAGEDSRLGPVMGPDHENDMPIAVSNPIFVDVDGGAFKPNGDLLGGELPIGDAGE